MSAESSFLEKKNKSVQRLYYTKSNYMKLDREAFLEMLESHKRIIFKICHSYCRDSEDQKDLVQEVIVQLWNSYHKYDDRFKRSTWVYRIALNVAISAYRKKITRNKHFDRMEEDSFVDIKTTDEDEQDENILRLNQFIAELDELNRALMILYLDDHSHDEIASILNISVSNVGTKINRIKQKIKREWTQR
ncbi:RNA polymerase sigma-70 factor, ECF subfamily [Reichenbachiella agariperforans]|uniref:RNA polymerase sigma-70 factor, ECF subfamily n=2 Tax=Reichenbachiella agariperforans TaxID=156994 RepID=A0A1M6PAR1_REIAG|nr:RNA polymerase sigma-70 factor, ECF subfamily [Reichenbachiella agariperforans]